MTAPLPKRIIKETERLQNEPVPGISAQPHDDNARYFDVWVDGPGGSCYDGQTPLTSCDKPTDFDLSCLQEAFSILNSSCPMTIPCVHRAFAS